MTTTIELPQALFDLYAEVKAHKIQELDSSGEDCRYCQREDRYVEVQAYATNIMGRQPVMVESCVGCLMHGLMLADADLLSTVTVEYER